MTDRERAIRAYAAIHRAFLRRCHPTAWRAMIDDGTIDQHCRRRAVEVFEARQRLELELCQQIADGERSAVDGDAVAIIAHEVAGAELRSL